VSGRMHASWLLIDELLEAVLDPGRWPRVLGVLEERLRAQRSRLDVLGPGGELLLTAVGTRPPQPIDPFAALGPASQVATRVRPRPLSSFEFAGSVARARFALTGSSVVAHLVLEREAPAGWPAPDRRELGLFVLHLERALRVTIRLQATPAVAASVAERATPLGTPRFWRELEEKLQRDFGLTRCETRVAIRFAQGSPIPRIAHDLGVTVETIRSHLKQIYRKLGATRQAELVHLLLTKGRFVPVPTGCD